MKIERIKKNHKKQIIIGGLIALCLISAITMTTSRAKYKLTENMELAKGTINYKPYDFKVMAMYQSEDGTNYTEINEMPGKNYKINESKSYCTINNVDKDNKAKIYTDKYGQHIIERLSKTEKCYIYFDKNTEIVSTTLGNIEVNNYTPDFSKIATSDEGIFKAEDGMYNGTSYYWRGATTTNHAIFANKCWRIVRINGDKTVRLIYNGTVKTGNTCIGNGTNNEAVIMGSNNSDRYYATSGGQYNNSSYVGWTYTLSSQRPSGSGTSSNAKKKTEEWYDSNIGNNITYASKIADGKFCNDRNTGVAPLGFDGFVTTWSATGTQFVYAAVDRVWNKYQLTLACDTGDVYTLKVGAITADEVMMAGGKPENNTSYYMYTGQNYWTMSPNNWNGTSASVFIVDWSGHLTSDNVNDTLGLRPVINLKSDITISSGNGTLDNPYIVS